MNIIVTNHAIIRRYQRFRSLYKEFNYEILTNDLITDFNNSSRIGFTKNAAMFKSNQGIYIIIYEEENPKIITTFPVNGIYKNDISVLANLKVIYKTIISDTIKREIEGILQSQDYTILKHEGSKKLLWTNEYLIFSSIDYDIENVLYTIYSIWTFDDLKNDKTLFHIRNTFFESDIKWNEFLKDIELLEYVYNPIKKELFPIEILTYQQVLNGKIPQFPINFWQEDIGGEIKIASQLCTKYMIEEVLKWNIHEICSELTKQTFIENKLGGMLDILFNNSIYEALDNAYPNKFPIGMIKNANTINYWRKENEGIKHAKKALSWVVEDCKKDGLIINTNVLLNYNWKAILKKYNITRILTITFENDYKNFLEQCFDVQISDEEYERYLNPLDKRDKQIRMHF